MQHLLAQAAGGDVSIWVDLATRLGVPTAILVAVLWYHVRTAAAKDAELARVNDLRVKEAQAAADKMFERDKTFMDLLGETDKTLALLLDRLEDMGRGGRR